MLPLHLSESTAKALFLELETERKANNRFFWPKGNQIGAITLQHDVVCRVKKKIKTNGETKDKPGFCYEFVDITARINSRSKNPVYLVAGTLSQEQFKPRRHHGKTGLPRQRLIKYQNITDEDPLSMLINEYQNASKAGMPGLKRLTILNDIAFLTMRKLPGHNLQRVLHGSRSMRGRPLSHQQRFHLGVALLDALDQQVVQHNIIHRDIKPDNIMVDFLPDGSPRVHIIDFGYSIDPAQPDKVSPGSLGYAAPECLRGEWYLQSSAMDVFSMAVVLLETFHFPQSVLKDSLQYRSRGKMLDLREYLDRLLKDAPGISEAFKCGIRTILYDMLNPIAEHRPSAREAAQRMRRLEPLAASNQSEASSSESPPSLPPPSRILAPPSRRRMARQRFFSERIQPLYRSSLSDVPALASSSTGSPDWY